MNIGWNSAPLTPYAGADRNIVNYIVFADGFGYTTPPYRPDYSQSHNYHFIVQVPASAGTLSFGVGDGSFDDNGGEYTISTYAVAAVPIPAAAWLFGSALGVMGVMRRKLTR